MATAVTLDGASAFGRFDHDFAVITPPAAWAVALGVLALIAAVAGGLFGGELVYRHGINVDVHSNLPPHDG